MAADSSTAHRALASRLAAAGFVAPDDEAGELLERAGGDERVLEELVARRLTGEPLAWIVGWATFCGLRIRVERGVYVPRWHSEALARRAAQRVPAGGVAVDVCTGSGAIARTLMERRPGARVVACDADERAVACARSNGVDAYRGDLLGAVPADLARRVDVVAGVVPYVPTAELGVLQRDTLTFESPRAYDGGADGLDLARRVVADAPRLLRPGGALLLELGGGQLAALEPQLRACGYRDVVAVCDDEGDERGFEAVYDPPPAR